MRAFSPTRWYVKAWLNIGFGLALLCSCARGTEVGNGNRPEEGERVQPEPTGSTPESHDDGFNLINWLLSPCGSPLREAESQLFTVPNPESQIKIERRGEIRDVEYGLQRWQIEPLNADDELDFAISVLAVNDSAASLPRPDYECGEFQSTASGSMLNRRLQLTMDLMQAELRWSFDLDAGLISEIELELGSEVIEVLGALPGD